MLIWRHGTSEPPAFNCKELKTRHGRKRLQRASNAMHSTRTWAFLYNRETEKETDDELPLVLPMRRSPGCVLCARAGARLHETPHLSGTWGREVLVRRTTHCVALHVHSCYHRSSQNVITTTEVEAMLDSSTAGIGVSCLTPIK